MAVVEGQSSAFGMLTDNAIALAISDTWGTLSEKRRALGLLNPGTIETISREVQRDVLASGHMFSGLRCDLQKTFSIAPVFRLQHALVMGSQGMAPWQLMALFGNSRLFMQAGWASDQSLNAWGNLRWTPNFVTKTQTQIAPGQPQTMIQIDNEYTGQDFSASLKAISPSILEGGLTGIMLASYLQSVTPRLALGLEGYWQRAGLNSRPETGLSYYAKYKGSDWLATAQYLAQGSIGASYWRKLTDKVEVGADCNLQFAPGLGGAGMFGGIRKEGSTQVGVKYDFTTSTYRAQIDNAGKVAVVLEKRIAPPIMITFAAEIDHKKNSHRLGLSVAIDGAPPELEEIAQSQSMDQNSIPPPY